MHPPPTHPSRRSLRELLGALLRWSVLIVGVLSSVATNLADEEGETEDEMVLHSCELDEDCAGVEGQPYCLDSYGLCVECRVDDDCEGQTRCYQQRCSAACESDDA